MEDLKTMMGKWSIEDINKQVNEFVRSADQHDDKLKLTVVLLNLIDESSKLLQSIDRKDFISEVEKEVEKISNQADVLSKEYNEHLKQNKEIAEVLSKRNDSQITQLQNQIRDLLKEYDTAIKKLVEAREKLPIEKQLEEEKK